MVDKVKDGIVVFEVLVETLDVLTRVGKGSGSVWSKQDAGAMAKTVFETALPAIHRAMAEPFVLLIYDPEDERTWGLPEEVNLHRKTIHFHVDISGISQDLAYFFAQIFDLYLAKFAEKFNPGVYMQVCPYHNMFGD
jgi:hypothetical protein